MNDRKRNGRYWKEGDERCMGWLWRNSLDRVKVCGYQGHQTRELKHVAQFILTFLQLNFHLPSLQIKNSPTSLFLWNFPMSPFSLQNNSFSYGCECHYSTRAQCWGERPLSPLNAQLNFLGEKTNTVNIPLIRKSSNCKIEIFPQTANCKKIWLVIEKAIG